MSVLLAQTLAACQPIAAPTPADHPSATTPTAAGVSINQAEQIVGVWTLTSHPHFKTTFWLLRPDGTYTFSPNQDGGRPSESGKYWFEGGQFLIKDDFCPTPGKYTVIKQDQGGAPSLAFTLVTDDCGARVKILTSSPEVWYGALQ